TRAARELGYWPNAIARSLITQRSKMIGIALAYLDNQYYPMALEKLTRRLQDEGFHTMVFIAQNKQPADEIVGTFLEYQVDGVILASVSLSSKWAVACERAGVPVVLFNRSQDEPDTSAVTSDNVEGGRSAARFLIEGGHQRIAYIAGWEGASTQRDREAGFLSELAARDVRLFDRAVGDFSREHAQEAARHLFDRPLDARPDAVFVCNDHMAIAALDVLRHELGISVPGEVSVVGYDDVPEAGWPSYALTTVRQPVNRMVETTVRLLLGRIDEPASAQQQVRIEGPLIVRQSARIPPGDKW
ncbi:MAG: LacI family DNA-binding transcriptional regulator, partial [Pseudomonadota bacterium]